MPVIINATSMDLVGEAQGSGRVSPVLLRAARDAVITLDEVARRERPRSDHADQPLPLIANWLSSITANPAANSMPDKLASVLRGYDSELAMVAVEEAIRSAASLLGINIDIVARDHTLILTNGAGGSIGCSIIDQHRLRDHSLPSDELRRWERARLEGFSHYFVLIFVDPTEYEDDIRRFKHELLKGDSGSGLYASNRILEPKHTYFLLQRTHVEPDATAERVMKYDVFISYNTLDRNDVAEIVQQLREAGIQPWFDRDELQPGSAPLRELEQQIEQIHSAAIFFGRKGMGPFQREEMDAILRRFITLERKVIPVVLAQSPSEFRLPLFLGNRAAVDFRCSSPPPMKELIWAITGRRPH